MGPSESCGTLPTCAKSSPARFGRLWRPARRPTSATSTRSLPRRRSPPSARPSHSTRYPRSSPTSPNRALQFADIYPDLRALLEPVAGAPLAVAEPLRTPSLGSKSTSAYLAHSYPTKVPPEAIEPYLLHHTRPGDLVLDPFCGSGMTGLAARRTGRRAVLNDLSFGAVHLAANAARHADPDAIANAGARVLAKLAEPYGRWYATTGRDGQRARIEWMLWSTSYECSSCA